MFVSFKLDLGLDRRKGGHVEVDVGDRFVVFLWHVGGEIGEGVYGSIGGDQDIGSSHDVWENFRLFDFI